MANILFLVTRAWSDITDADDEYGMPSERQSQLSWNSRRHMRWAEAEVYVYRFRSSAMLNSSASVKRMGENITSEPFNAIKGKIEMPINISRMHQPPQSLMKSTRWLRPPWDIANNVLCSIVQASINIYLAWAAYRSRNKHWEVQPCRHEQRPLAYYHSKECASPWHTFTIEEKTEISYP